MNTFHTLKDALNAVESQETRTEHCDIHGEFTSKHILKSVWSRCPACSEIESKKREEEELEKDRKKQEEIWKTKLGRSEIPERFHDRTLESYVASTKAQKDALDFAIQYANEFDEKRNNGRCAVFCGQPGTGKTHISVGIGISVMKKGHKVIFTTVQRLMRRVKDAWRKDSTESESDVIEIYTYPDILILDEIGVQFGSEFERNVLFDILNERYENRMPTILLSNLSPNEVMNFLGERVFDRLREDGGKVIPFDWKSYRGRKDAD